SRPPARRLAGRSIPQTLTEMFGRERKAAGLLAVTLHILRHTHATLALSGGADADGNKIAPVPLHVVAARIRDRPKAVLKTYTHLVPAPDLEAAEQVAALIVR